MQALQISAPLSQLALLQSDVFTSRLPFDLRFVNQGPLSGSLTRERFLNSSLFAQNQEDLPLVGVERIPVGQFCCLCESTAQGTSLVGSPSFLVHSGQGEMVRMVKRSP